MQKILFLTPRFYPNLGGVEKHVLEISKELSRQGFEISVFYEDTQNYQSDSLTDKEVKASVMADISVNSDSEMIGRIKKYKFNFGGVGKLKKFRIWKTLWKNRKLIRQLVLGLGLGFLGMYFCLKIKKFLLHFMDMRRFFRQV